MWYVRAWSSGQYLNSYSHSARPPRRSAVEDARLCSTVRHSVSGKCGLSTGMYVAKINPTDCVRTTSCIAADEY